MHGAQYYVIGRQPVGGHPGCHVARSPCGRTYPPPQHNHDRRHCLMSVFFSVSRKGFRILPKNHRGLCNGNRDSVEGNAGAVVMAVAVLGAEQVAVLDRAPDGAAGVRVRGLVGAASAAGYFAEVTAAPTAACLR